MTQKIKFFTPVEFPIHDEKIYCGSKILTLGSCFSDHIGRHLANSLFDVLVNPFGTVFNPMSCSKLLDLAISNKLLDINELHSNGSRFFHYDFHSSFDDLDPKETVKKVNKAIIEVNAYLRKIDFLVLTFGTSIVYRLIENGRIVSNCHKVPSTKFKKEFLSVAFMEERMLNVLALLKTINPAVKVILTVSPVRHTKEGLINNSRSKAQLIELCHRLKENEKQVTYFPAFEIMVDELRDYRYYGADLIHPNEQAVDIIWNRFIDTFFSKDAIKKVEDISALNAAKNHLPFDPHSEEHHTFKRNQSKKLQVLKKKYPEVDFVEYEKYFKT